MNPHITGPLILYLAIVSIACLRFTAVTTNRRIDDPITPLNYRLFKWGGWLLWGSGVVGALLRLLSDDDDLATMGAAMMIGALLISLPIQRMTKTLETRLEESAP